MPTKLCLKVTLIHFVSLKKVIGPMANNTAQQFGDYSPDIDNQYTTTPLDGLRKMAENVQYTSGCPDNRCIKYNQTDVKNAVNNAEAVFVCLGTGEQYCTNVENQSHVNVKNRMPCITGSKSLGKNICVICSLYCPYNTYHYY